MVEPVADEVCNDPVLCSNCTNMPKWPKCMKDVKLRGYHPIFNDSFDDVVVCTNYVPTEPPDWDR